MANYVQKLLNWIGHSVNDTVPALSNVLGHTRLDTDTGRQRYYDGSDWKDFNNSFMPFSIKTAAYTLTDLDRMILVDSTTAAFTLMLPSAVGRLGKHYKIKKIATPLNTVTIDPNGTETIDGFTTWALRWDEEYIEIVSDGTNWKTLDYSKFDVHAYRKIGLSSPRYYIAGQISNTALASNAVTQNLFYAHPFIVPKVSTLNDIAINVITGVASSAVKIGLYNDSGNLFPTSLLFDSGELATATSAVFVNANISPAMKLQAGLYWLTLIFTGQPTIRHVPLASEVPLIGIDNAAATTAGAAGFYKSPVTYPAGALPDPYPSGPVANLAANVPAIYTRFV